MHIGRRGGRGGGGGGGGRNEEGGVGQREKEERMEKKGRRKKERKKEVRNERQYKHHLQLFYSTSLSIADANLSPYQFCSVQPGGDIMTCLTSDPATTGDALKSNCRALVLSNWNIYLYIYPNVSVGCFGTSGSPGFQWPLDDRANLAHDTLFAIVAPFGSIMAHLGLVKTLRVACNCMLFAIVARFGLIVIPVGSIMAHVGLVKTL